MISMRHSSLYLRIMTRLRSQGLESTAGGSSSIWVTYEGNESSSMSSNIKQNIEQVHIMQCSGSNICQGFASLAAGKARAGEIVERDGAAGVIKAGRDRLTIGL